MFSRTIKYTYRIFKAQKVIIFTLRIILVFKTVLLFPEKLRLWSYYLMAFDGSIVLWKKLIKLILILDID